MRTKYIYIMLTILAMMLFLLNIFCGAVAIDPHDTLQILMAVYPICDTRNSVY